MAFAIQFAGLDPYNQRFQNTINTNYGRNVKKFFDLVCKIAEGAKVELISNSSSSISPAKNIEEVEIKQLDYKETSLD